TSRGSRRSGGSRKRRRYLRGAHRGAPRNRGVAPRGAGSRQSSLTDAERRDDLAVPLDVVAAQVVEQAAALADQLQEPAAGVVILRVRLEVLGQIGDALGEQRDLH